MAHEKGQESLEPYEPYELPSVSTTEPPSAARSADEAIDSPLGPRRYSETKELPTVDADIVDWDGPDDPQNPMNWSKGKRFSHVAIVSLLTLVTNLAATMLAPGVPLLMQDLNVTNSTIGSFTVSIYLVGFALGPLCNAPLSELYGRLPIYHICNLVFLAFMIACAVAPNVGSFLFFRTVAGWFGSAPVTIGGGSIADLIPQEQRGVAMALFVLGPLLGPAIGPVIGGFLSEYVGWEWVFWLIAIMSGVLSIVSFIFMSETYHAVLLRRKAEALRKQTGNMQLRSKHHIDVPASTFFLQNLVRPMKLLLLSPIVLALSTFAAFVFGLTFLLFTTFPMVFEQQYGFGPGISGLAYLGFGIGMVLGVGIIGRSSDAMLKSRAERKGGGEMKPEYRLPLMIYFAPAIPIGFFWYGWSAHAQVHWICPIIGSSLIGIGTVSVIVSDVRLLTALSVY
ncbi:hypothetical protein FQN54_006399 [Arachnomyces sp. PD_36]|nr:hypothetical protein FQN54_006399 [Arachnomyces sp. PD_36]